MVAIHRTNGSDRLFLKLFVVFLLISFVYISSFNKTECFVKLNPSHPDALNNFFVYFTFLGNGLFALVLFVVFLFYRQWLLAVHHVMAFLVSGLAAQLLKQLIQAPRPKTFIDPGSYSGFIDGITHAGMASFPSGHTATAFAMATVFSFYAKNNMAAVFFQCMAIAVGYSRVYLGQHFVEDVIAGSIIGVLSGIIIFRQVKSITIPQVMRGKVVEYQVISKQ